MSYLAFIVSNNLVQFQTYLEAWLLVPDVLDFSLIPAIEPLDTVMDMNSI